MIHLIVGAGIVAKFAVVLPEKAAFVGKPLARGRIAAVHGVRRLVDSAHKAGAIDSAEATGIKKSLAVLGRNARQGWSSDPELGALCYSMLGAANAGVGLGLVKTADAVDYVLGSITDALQWSPAARARMAK